VLTRRNAIAIGGSALLVAGCGGRPARKLAGSPADLHFLDGALEIERAQIALYESALRVLTGAHAAVARRALGHERAHADAIGEAIRELGGTPAAPKARALYERGLPHAASPGAWVATAIQREQAAAAAYGAAIPKLANLRLRATFAAIMTTEAEHAAALGIAR